MKYSLFIISVLFVLTACNEERPISSVSSENWEKRSVRLSDKDSLLTGVTYLPVYSEIYSFSESQTTFLTVTVSMRNINTDDVVYITRADYFDTHGKRIRSYFEKPISLKPLETVEIIIDEADNLGGVGGNFIFEWATENIRVNDPFFEAVMISTKGQQGLSFTTNGIKLKN
ncbi:DUF3124 domain-containing protein [Zhouia spongiae]|uniref:DUF3124 domain-containing protein n=1 Tax=Zhouia spongiae TaxID=2202721 RepID=A0ABY3YP91_9FLAO|nr:DUF3124 domain-containing protein [Zhouia spongiae]UNY99667.1 DUF3124 domain-containing protein [Zhouia spongiae]